MALWLQLIMNGIIAGALYALIASGFSLIFNLQKFLHIAHGGVYVVSAFLAWFFVIKLNLHFILAFVITLIIAAILGILINKFIYGPIEKAKGNRSAMLLASFGVFIFLQSIVLLIFGADTKSFSFSITKGYEFFGAIITTTQIIILTVSVALFVLLQLFLRKTKIGKALRAAADNKAIASTLGINIDKLAMITFAIGSVLAATAGVLVAVEQNLDHTMGLMAVFKGITASVVGGMGNVPAAILGGFFLGVVENIGIWFLPSGWKDAIAFIILIVFLLFRPQGLFGLKRREEFREE